MLMGEGVTLQRRTWMPASVHAFGPVRHVMVSTSQGLTNVGCFMIRARLTVYRICQAQHTTSENSNAALREVWKQFMNPGGTL